MAWAIVWKSLTLDFWKDATTCRSPLLKSLFWSPVNSSELPSSRMISLSGKGMSTSQLFKGVPNDTIVSNPLPGKKRTHPGQ